MSDNPDITSLTVEVVSAFVGQNNIRSNDVPAFIAATHAAIAALSATPLEVTSVEAEAEHKPMISARKSLSSKDHIISLIDGKPYRVLKRHLSGHGLTPDQYRERYKLPATYPMVAESYSATRREMAKRIALGRKPGTKVERKAPAAEPKSVSVPRKTRARKDAVPE